MAYIGTSYLVGLFFASFLSCGINIFAAVGIIISAAGMPVIFGKKYVKSVVCVISGAAAMLVYGLYETAVYRNIVKYDGYDVEIIGTVSEYAEHSGDKASYIVKGVINGDVRAEVMFYTDSSDAEIGDRITVTGTAQRLKNKYTFPAEDYYKAKGIYLQINKISNFSHTPDEGFSLRKTLNRYREYIIGRICGIMDEDSAAVMSAMLFGDKSDLESTAKTAMYRAGIGHIMAVSGVHISVVCAFFWTFVSRINMGKALRFGLIMLPVCCFALLAGMSSSVTRAAIMAAAVYGAELFRRRADTYNSLGIAVILLTAASPFAVRDASFLLSVMGVFGVGVAAPEAIKLAEKKLKLGKIGKSAVTSLCVSAVIFPVSMLFFDEVSVVSPISNLLLMPICMAVMVGGLIVTVTGGISLIAVPVLKICDILCRFILAAVGFIGRLRFSYIPLGNDFAKAAVIVSVCLAVAVLIVTKKADIAALTVTAMFALSVIAVNIYRAIPDGRVTIAVLKDGNAVTAVVHDKKSAGIIDLNKGGRTSAAAVKYLNRLGICKIDGLILNTDANVSLPVYGEALELFEVRYALIPEKDAAFASENFFGGRIYTYDSLNSIEMEKYSVGIVSEGIVLISANGAEFIFYDSDFPAEKTETEYDGAVRYAGKSGTDPEAGILAAMNANAVVETKSGRTVYIGESFFMTVGRDGSVESQILE